MHKVTTVKTASNINISEIRQEKRLKKRVMIANKTKKVKDKRSFFAYIPYIGIASLITVSLLFIFGRTNNLDNVRLIIDAYDEQQELEKEHKAHCLDKTKCEHLTNFYQLGTLDTYFPNSEVSIKKEISKLLGLKEADKTSCLANSYSFILACRALAVYTATDNLKQLISGNFSLLSEIRVMLPTQIAYPVLFSKLLGNAAPSINHSSTASKEFNDIFTKLEQFLSTCKLDKSNENAQSFYHIFYDKNDQPRKILELIQTIQNNGLFT